MHTLSLSHADPFCSFISADSRFHLPDQQHDFSWAFSLQGGDPPSIRLSTTFGLLAQCMRLYPAMGWDDTLISDPENFVHPPVIEALYPDFVRLSFEPLAGLLTRAEFWVTEPTTLLCRFHFENADLDSHQVRMKLYADFLAQHGSGGMRKAMFKGSMVLTGAMEGLDAVLAACAGAIVQESTHPALVVRDRIDPGGVRTWQFALSVKEDFHRSVVHAREQCTFDWEAQLAQLEQRNASLLEVETGEPDWDAVFWMTQREIYRHRHSPTRKLRVPSLLTRRCPDDPGQAGVGQNGEQAERIPGVAQAYWMALQVLDTDPSFALDVVRVYLSAQEPDGFTDGHPGQHGERSGTMAIPLLADLTWKVYQRSGDREELAGLYPGLKKSFEAWFSPRNDADQDGHPEWRSTFQAGFDVWPAFLRWQKWGQGLDIAYAETMDLAAYLYNEAGSLRAMADLLGRQADALLFQEHAERLSNAVEAAWDERSAIYRHVDRDLHVSVKGKRIARGKGAYAVDIAGRYEEPVRLIVRVRCKESNAKSVEIRLHGRGQRGRPRIERINVGDFSWFWDYGIATTEKTYMVLSQVDVSGLPDTCSSEVSIADFTREDQSGLLPLWAGMASKEHAEALIARSILDEERFWRPQGIPMCSAGDKTYDPDGDRSSGVVSMLWSSMLGEGLVDVGRLEDAGELLSRLMQPPTEALRTDHRFYAGYSPETGRGVTGAGEASGVAPLSLFLRVLGVRLYSPQKVWVRGHHPLPWPVILRWKGLKLRLEAQSVEVTFPDGQTQHWDNSAPMLIEQVENHGR